MGGPGPGALAPGLQGFLRALCPAQLWARPAAPGSGSPGAVCRPTPRAACALSQTGLNPPGCPAACPAGPSLRALSAQPAGAGNCGPAAGGCSWPLPLVQSASSCLAVECQELRLAPLLTGALGWGWRAECNWRRASVQASQLGGLWWAPPGLGGERIRSALKE